MPISEVMTTISLFHMPHHRSFKNFYTSLLKLLSSFIKLIPQAVNTISSRFNILKFADSDICFINSTSIKVYLLLITKEK